MRDLLRRFGSVPLALAAYNAGAGAVGALRLHPALSGDAGLRRARAGADGRGGRGGAGRRRTGGKAGELGDTQSPREAPATVTYVAAGLNGGAPRPTRHAKVTDLPKAYLSVCAVYKDEAHYLAI